VTRPGTLTTAQPEQAASPASGASPAGVARFLADFTNFAANGGSEGPVWLSRLRHEAIGRFATLGFPTPKNEDWHYTSVAPIAEAEFRTLDPSVLSGQARPGDLLAADLAPFTFGRPDWPTLVFVNGRYRSELSNVAALPDGVRATDFATALREDEELVHRHLARHASTEQNAFTALNTAFAHDGAVVHIGKEMVADAPIHLLFVSDATAAKGVAHPRVLIVAERHSKATVLESYVALGQAPYFTNVVTEVSVEDGATLAHLRIQRESERAYHIGTVEVTQGRDSHFVSFSFAVGAALSRTNIYTLLDGEGCGATLNGLYMVDGQQHVDHQTRIEHAQPNCFSREVYKGILDGASRAVFNGKVYVHPIAQKTDGKQENNNLLLSERAHVDTKPQLEIFADDVKCTHGATVGRMDENALFYMLSRGIDREQARHLLTYAFAASVLETIELDAVREGLEGLTLERFTGEEERGATTESRA
jgi:Fe-S cluster assembly protein SufD